MDSEHIRRLVRPDNQYAQLVASLTDALPVAAHYLGLTRSTPPLKNGCAATLSTMLRSAGVNLKIEGGAGKLVTQLKKRGWTMVPVGQQSPGDVGVTLDLTEPIGADHIYLVAEIMDRDTVLIADNQSAKLHRRNVGAGMHTRTEYFLRAPLMAESDLAALSLDAPTTAIVITAVDQSEALRQYAWKDRGEAPLAYLRGMAVGFAAVYKRLSTDPIVKTMAVPVDPGEKATDALAYYADEFQKIGLAIGPDEGTTLRALFVLLIGLGMRESSGKHCAGRHIATATSETAEAGLFQTSYDLTLNASNRYQPIIKRYANSTLLLDLFSDGVKCKPEDAHNIGTGTEGVAFQQLTKTCPAFAIEVAAVGLRYRRQHWGPVDKKHVEVIAECNTLLKAVQWIID